jgi:hypothetical protein
MLLPNERIGRDSIQRLEVLQTKRAKFDEVSGQGRLQL